MLLDSELFGAILNLITSQFQVQNGIAQRMQYKLLYLNAAGISRWLQLQYDRLEL